MANFSKTVFVLVAAICSVSAYCPNSCNGHGTCEENDKCKCYRAWTANDCSQRICPFGVSWTTMTADNLEASSAPAKGETITTTDGKQVPRVGYHPYAECSNKGNCDRSTGECKCHDGYEGKGCRRSECPNGCSAHGQCVQDMAYNRNYGFDARNQYQSAYWNGKKSQKCMCDAGWGGNACNERLCPKGAYVEQGCNDNLVASSDVQAFVLTHTGIVDAAKKIGDDNMKIQNLDTFFTVTYTDENNRKYQTRPLSYFSNENEIEEALKDLPNKVVKDIDVRVAYASNAYADVDATSVSKAGGKKTPFEKKTGFSRTFKNTAGGDAKRIDHSRCEQLIYEMRQHTGCATHADCALKTGLPAWDPTLKTGEVVCAKVSATYGDYQCIEISHSALEKNAFVNADLTKAENPDMVGRRIRSNDLECHLGFFDPDSMYATTCTTDSDCIKCQGDTDISQLGPTNIRSGICSSTTKKCTGDIENAGAPKKNLKRKFEMALAESGCQSRIVFIKFTGHSGKQNKLEIRSADKFTDYNGATPRYFSQNLIASEVLHVGVPDIKTETGMHCLNIATDSTTGIASQSLGPCPTVAPSFTKNYPDVLSIDFKVVDDADSFIVGSANNGGVTTAYHVTVNSFLEDQRGWLARNQKERGDAVDQIIAHGSTECDASEKNCLNEVAGYDNEGSSEKPLYGCRFFRKAVKANAAEPDDVTEFLYKAVEISAAKAEYKTLFPCSNNGQCDIETGVCSCKSGYVGEACEDAVSNV